MIESRTQLDQQHPGALQTQRIMPSTLSPMRSVRHALIIAVGARPVSVSGCDRQTNVASRRCDRDQLSEVRANAFAAAFLIPETGVKSFLEQRNKCGGTRESFPVYDDATEKSGAMVQASRRAEAHSQDINCQLVAHLAYHFGVSYIAACYRLKSLKCINDEKLKELLSKEEQALRFLDILKVKDELLGKDDPKKVKPDRELTVELLSLATEAYNRELISKAKLVELGALVDIERKDMLGLVGE
jgi:Zn-dependent peptidase ImmA (M78 family)